MPGKKLLPFEREVIKKREEKFIPAWMRGRKAPDIIARKGPGFAASLKRIRPYVAQGPTKDDKPKAVKTPKKPSKFKAGLSRALEAAAYGITANVGAVPPGQEVKAGILKGVAGMGLASAARRKRAFEAGKPARELETYKAKLKAAQPGKLAVARASGEEATKRAITISKLEKPLSQREKQMALKSAGKIAFDAGHETGTPEWYDARAEEYLRNLRTTGSGGLSYKGFK